MAISRSTIRVVHADAQRGIGRAEDIAPHRGEVALDAPTRVVEQANVRISTSSGQNRRKTVNRDVDNFVGAVQMALNGRGNLRSERAVELAEEFLAGIGGEAARDAGKDARVPLGPVEINEEAGGRGVEEGRAEPPGHLPGEIERTRIPPPVSGEKAADRPERRGEILRDTVAPVLAGDDEGVSR